MITRALLAWLALLLFAILNGALRQAILIPYFGERAGQIVSTLLLSAIILGAAWVLLPWIHPRTGRDAWIVGALWLVLTVAFEFLGGHYLFGDPWEELLAAYNLAQGQIWVLVLITTLVAPVVVFPLRARSGAVG